MILQMTECQCSPASAQYDAAFFHIYTNPLRIAASDSVPRTVDMLELLRCDLLLVTYPSFSPFSEIRLTAECAVVEYII